MKNRIYIPGFDWVRLLGCMLITLSHTYLNRWAAQLVPRQVVAILGEVVPIFFLMAGYLMHQSLNSKDQPFRYVVRYVTKYGLIFLLLNLFYNINLYFGIYRQSGIFYFKSLVIDMLLLPFYFPYLEQLWFIPPLLVGIVLNSYIYRKRCERKCLPGIALYTILIIIWNIYGGYFVRFPLIEHVVSWEYFSPINYFLYRSAWGILYVFIGMWIAKNRDVVSRIKLRFAILPMLVITSVELCLMLCFSNPLSANLGLNISTCMLSTIIFLAILRIKGDFLKKYHTYISLFSGLMYFLHTSQQSVLEHWTDNGILIFFIITAANAMLTAVIVKILRLNKGKVQHGL